MGVRIPPPALRSPIGWHTAFATDLVVDKTGTLNPEEIFNQSVYQFASTRAASSFCTTPLTQGPPQPTQSSGCPLYPLISGPVT